MHHFSNIKYIFFDLDHTLWDYDQNAYETLKDIYEKWHLKKEDIPLNEFVDIFHKINTELWSMYDCGLIDKQELKTIRFSKIFQNIKPDVSFVHQVSDYFISNCCTKPHLMPGVLKGLDYLSKKYSLNIITNGFNDAQNKKLHSTGIKKYFHKVITSESANARKPSPDIFQYALKVTGAKKSHSIMIGDNLGTDIQGAMNFGMKTVFYNHKGEKNVMADLTIRSHTELLELF